MAGSVFFNWVSKRWVCQQLYPLKSSVKIQRGIDQKLKGISLFNNAGVLCVRLTILDCQYYILCAHIHMCTYIQMQNFFRA